MKYFWFIGLMLVSITGYGQKMKLGFRTGVSSSNFYHHYHPGKIPHFTISPVEYSPFPENDNPVSNPNPNPAPITISPKTHPDLFYDHFETNIIQDMRIGIFSYVHLNWEIKDRVSAEVGLGYSQRGINMKYRLQSTSKIENNNIENLSYQFDRNLRLDYIVIPVTIHYQLDRKERFYALAGIYNAIAVNFLIKESMVLTERQTLSANGQNLGKSTSRSWSEKAYAGLFDSGLIGGMGMNIPLTHKIGMGIEIRSSFGLTTVPRKFDQYGFQSFSERAKNLNIESGINLHYVLN